VPIPVVPILVVPIPVACGFWGGFINSENAVDNCLGGAQK
jgi:hypothetical protein